ncbi:uncharacterized protein LOC126982675 [Eriocheir sinensis]|uniref:uncharacterized protein LOC126982675 n=1 Tax=Eriocheir sinensis TaxID=95602 RepID=UPI0021CA6DDA|nr:uncharacterized protein LOC126982675 [Eriocheir sinensis]
MAKLSLQVMAVTVLVCLGAGLLVAGQEADPTFSSSLWSPGRITQVTLAVLQSALLTFILLFPGIMDPIVKFINESIGTAGSRRRRDVQAVVTEHAAALHGMVLDAVDRFEDMDQALSSPIIS